MPRRTTTRLTVPRVSATCAGYLLYLAEMRAGSIDESAYPAGTEPGCSLCGVPAPEGHVYVRYGNTTCGSGSTLLYAGFVVGQQHNVIGGSIGGYCFHPDPQHLPDQYPGTQAARSSLYGTEYQTAAGYVTPDSTRPSAERDVACAVCQRRDVIDSCEWSSDEHTCRHSAAPIALAYIWARMNALPRC